MFPKPEPGHPSAALGSARSAARSSALRSLPFAVPAAAAILLASGCDTARQLETGVGATHVVPFVSQHKLQALQDVSVCQSCHGADFAGGEAGVSCTSCHAIQGWSDWQTNCTFCHGTQTQGWAQGTASLLAVAPPRGVLGESLPSDAAVGAHQRHLGVGTSFSLGVACTECHTVPTDLTHVKMSYDASGNLLPAPLAFGPIATQGGLQPSYANGQCSNTYCHGGSMLGAANPAPTWTAAGSVACGDCHGLPPGSGGHVYPDHVGKTCYQCHSQVGTATATPGIQPTQTALGLHVNGAKDVSFAVAGTWDPVAKSCSNVECHTLAPAVRYW